MCIEISENKDVWESRIELSFSDGREVDIEEEARRALLVVDSDTEIVLSWVEKCKGGEGGRLEGEVRVDQSENSTIFWFPAVVGPRRVRVRSARKTK